MIFITGDCHADFRRFNTTNFPQQYEMSRNDYVIAVGDLGLIWDGSRNDEHWIEWFSEKPFTLLFIDGNHDNHEILSGMPEGMWNGGKTHYVSPNIYHLMRGQVFDIDGKKFFTFGGARSDDIQDGVLDPEDPEFKTKRREYNDEGKMYRIKGVSWWEEEMPSDDEYAEGIKELDAAGWNVGYILTHCAPTGVQSLMSGVREPNELTDYLEDIRKKCRYDRWFFGHYHEEKQVTDRDVCLYEKIIRIE